MTADRSSYTLASLEAYTGSFYTLASPYTGITIHWKHTLASNTSTIQGKHTLSKYTWRHTPRAYTGCIH